MRHQGKERGPIRRHWLPVLLACAALPSELWAASAQTPAEPAPASASQTQPTAAAGQLEPTPEQLGDALAAHQRYQAAIEAYKKASPESSIVWNKMGIAYQMMYNLREASRCYQASLKLNPKNPNVLNNLGTVYDSLKDYGAAERMYRKALKLEPESALVRKNLGTAQLARHKYKQGWENYQAALAIDPKVFDDSGGLHVDNPASSRDRGAMNYYMARGCVRVGQNDRAIEYLRMALNEGFANPKMIAADNEFAGLREMQAFKQLLADQSAQ